MVTKTLLNVLMICLLVTFTSCDNTYSGNVDLSGFCIDTCDGSPLIHHKVTFNRLFESFHTFTDSKGFFHLTGNYSFESRKEIESGYVTFQDTTSNNNCCFGFYLFADDLVLHGDTFYRYRITPSIIRIYLNPNVTTSSLDTLFLEKSGYRTFEGTYPSMFRANPPGYDFYYHKKYIGPFTNGQILDTVSTMLDTHVGFSFARAATIKHYNPDKGLKSHYLDYSFVVGQRNSGCGLIQELEVHLD